MTSHFQILARGILLFLTAFSSVTPVAIAARHSHAKSAKNNGRDHDDDVVRLVEAIQHYRNQPEVDWEVEKKIFSTLLNQTTTSTGHFYFSRKLFQIQFPEESAIYDGKSFWLIAPSPGGDARQITKSTPEKASNILLDIFQLKKTSSKQLFTKLGGGRFQLVKKAGSTLDDVIVQLGDDDRLKSISYKDDLDNRTEFTFRTEKFLSKAKPDLFRFKKKNSDQMTEM